MQTVSAQIPWSHNVTIIEKVKDSEKREWYINKTIENGWSHGVLVHQIESGLYGYSERRYGKQSCKTKIRRKK